MHPQSVVRSQFCRQFVNREIGPRRDPALHPALDAGQFATSGVALRLWRERSGLTHEPHHIVDKLDRNAQPPRRLGMRVTLRHKRNGTFTQLNRMRFTHL